MLLKYCPDRRGLSDEKQALERELNSTWKMFAERDTLLFEVMAGFGCGACGGLAEKPRARP